VGNQPKEPQTERRAKVEALKKQQKAKERKKTVVVVGVAVVVAAGLIAVPTAKIISDNRKANIEIAQIGAPIDLAQCDGEITDEVPATDARDHVEGKVDYATDPPSYGDHNATWVTVNNRGFYTPDDAPEIEQLVHNLEHGYTIAWYDPDISEEEKEELRILSKRLRGDSEYKKFIATPWDKSRGELPSGKKIALTHWGTEGSQPDLRAFRQYCGLVSGPVTSQFMNKHPRTHAPEPNTP
jgi:hypothetical protein